MSNPINIPKDDIYTIINLLKPETTYTYDNIIKIIDEVTGINALNKVSIINSFNRLYWRGGFRLITQDTIIQLFATLGEYNKFKKEYKDKKNNKGQTDIYINMNIKENEEKKKSKINTNKSIIGSFQYVLDKMVVDGKDGKEVKYYSYQDIINIINETDSSTLNKAAKDLLERDLNRLYYLAKYPDIIIKNQLIQWLINKPPVSNFHDIMDLNILDTNIERKIEKPTFLELYDKIKFKPDENNITGYDKIIEVIKKKISESTDEFIKINFRRFLMDFQKSIDLPIFQFKKPCIPYNKSKLTLQQLRICIETFQNNYLVKCKIKDIIEAYKNLGIDVKKVFINYNKDDAIDILTVLTEVYKWKDRGLPDYVNTNNQSKNIMNNILVKPINQLTQFIDNKLFNKFGPTEVTSPFSSIPVYRQDVMKRFFQTYLENIEKTKDELKDRVVTTFISEPKKVNKLTKLSHEELHKKNMMIYYIIPLVYLIYSYVYIKFNKQQKLRIMYRETKLTYEMYAFLFDRRNPVIKKVNVYFHETFKKEDKIQSVDDKKLLGPMIDNKKQIIDFLQFVEQQIIAENDYITELKRVEDIILHLEVIQRYLKESINIDTASDLKKTSIKNLDNSIFVLQSRLKNPINNNTKIVIQLNINSKKRELEQLKRNIYGGSSHKIYKGGEIKTIENLISDQRNSKLQKNIARHMIIFWMKYKKLIYL